MARRHQQLEDSLRLHKFIYDVEDEKAWMREREPLARSTDLGNNLTSVHILLKKHQVQFTYNQSINQSKGGFTGLHEKDGSGSESILVHVSFNLVGN